MVCGAFTHPSGPLPRALHPSCMHPALASLSCRDGRHSSGISDPASPPFPRRGTFPCSSRRMMFHSGLQTFMSMTHCLPFKCTLLRSRLNDKGIRPILIAPAGLEPVGFPRNILLQTSDSITRVASTETLQCRCHLERNQPSPRAGLQPCLRLSVQVPKSKVARVGFSPALPAECS